MGILFYYFHLKILTLLYLIKRLRQINVQSFHRAERNLSSENLVNELQDTIKDLCEKGQNPQPKVEDLYSRIKDKDEHSNLQ